MSFKVTENGAIRQIAYVFLLAFPVTIALSCTVSEIKARYLSKIANFYTKGSVEGEPVGISIN